ITPAVEDDEDERSASRLHGGLPVHLFKYLLIVYCFAGRNNAHLRLQPRPGGAGPIDSMQFILDNWYLFLALIVVLALLLAPTVMQQMHGIKSLSPSQAVLLVNRESGVFVDISEPSEF